MCDTLCVIGAGRTLFGKNSDRPRDEVQVLESHGARAGGGRLRTTYLELDDPGAHAFVGARPAWMWGTELGVNEHGVAIGNERIYTVDDPAGASPALTGMDLVRLGLERAASADGAIDVITTMLEQHGQGGRCAEGVDDPYWSSFLVADPHGAWVLETSARTWAARRVDDGASISNRVGLGADWDRASVDVVPGDDFSRRIDPTAPVQRADVRLAATRACVATGAAILEPADIVATLRHHGTRPWGAPGRDESEVELPPPPTEAEQDRPTVCWHDHVKTATTASLVAALPSSVGAPLRAWAALGSPCASVYLPLFPPEGVPPSLGEPATWARFARLRDRVETDGSALVDIRARFGPLETRLWAEADAIAADGSERTAAFAATSWRAVDDALVRLGV